MKKELLLLALCGFAACSSSGSKDEGNGGNTGEKAETYQNPVIAYSLPDPSVIRGDDGYFYLYATEDIRNLPIHRSKDLVNWEMVGTAFTDQTRPDFEPDGGLWAPDINKVGDRYVLERMIEAGYNLGGEQSGHIIFSKYATTGDGMLTAIKLMQVMLDRKKKLSELAAPVREYPQQLTNVEVDDKDATLSDPTVVAAVQAVTERLGDEGRILLRKSGTEPVLRVMVEAGTHELCEENVAYVIDVMQKSGHLIRVR